MRKRLLLVCYYYPPAPEVASVRTGNLAKYFSEFGWDVTVVTSPSPNRNLNAFGWPVIEVSDPGVFPRIRSLLRRQNRRRAFHNTSNGGKEAVPRLAYQRVWKIANQICYFPDPQANWRVPVIEACRQLANSSFDIVLTSSSPQTCHVIGHELKQKRLADRWVADFRDLWTQNHYREEYYSLWRNRIEQAYERRILADADLLVTVSDPMAQQLGRLHSDKPVKVITNGFAPDKCYEVAPNPKFTIVYTGQLYAGRRDPTPLFEALQLLNQGEGSGERAIRIRFFGDNPAWLSRLAADYGLTEEVELCGNITREQVMEQQRRATVLLLLNWDHPAEAGTYTGKIFEYLSARRPILAIGGPQGVLAKLLGDTSAGYHVNTTSALLEVLSTWFDEFRLTGNVKFKGDEERIQQYSWPHLASRYSKLLDSWFPSI